MKKAILLLPFLLLPGCKQETKQSTLEWCIIEIAKNEKYSQFTYTYELLYSHNVSLYDNLDYYIITTYTNTKRTEWYCNVSYNQTKKKLTKEDIYSVHVYCIEESTYIKENANESN